MNVSDENLRMAAMPKHTKKQKEAEMREIV